MSNSINLTITDFLTNLFAPKTKVAQKSYPVSGDYETIVSIANHNGSKFRFMEGVNPQRIEIYSSFRTITFTNKEGKYTLTSNQ